MAAVVALMAALLSGGCATARPEASPEPVRLATYAYPAYDREQALSGLAALVRDQTGRPVVTTLYATPNALAGAIRDGHVDLAMTNLAAFISIADDPDVQPLAVLAVPAATLDGYRGVLLARRDAGVAGLADLAGQASRLRYVEVLPGSTSGALVQRDAFRGAGFDIDAFARLDHAGTHDAAVEALVTGQADLAATAEAPWIARRRADPEGVAGLVELWRSPPLPPGPVICVQGPTMPCGALGRRLPQGDMLARQAARSLAAGWAETEGAAAFDAYDPAPYAPFLRR